MIDQASAPAADNAEFTTTVGAVVAAYLANNHVAVTDIANLTATVAASLRAASAPVASTAAPVDETVKPTAAQIRKSVTPEAIISFIDGKPYKTLKRHLTTNGMTVAEYKAKFGLPNDYPTTSPMYSEVRSAMAKSLGLGQGGRRPKSSAAVAAQVAAAPAPKAPKAAAAPKAPKPAKAPKQSKTVTAEAKQAAADLAAAEPAA
jgi:predicted transcriptional regulator